MVLHVAEAHTDNLEGFSHKAVIPINFLNAIE